LRRVWSTLCVLQIALSVGACDSGPRALVAREDACRYCRMTIDDVRFGAMVMTARGRIETFDSIECLASFVASIPVSAPPKGIWVADFETPARWVEVHRARFLHLANFRSPMGRDLAAFGQDVSPEALEQKYGGRVLDWTAVQALIAHDAFAPTGAQATLRPSTAAAGADAPHTH